MRLGFLRYWPPAEAGGDELDDDSEDEIEAPKGTASTEAEVDSHIFLVILFYGTIARSHYFMFSRKKIAKKYAQTHTVTFHGKIGFSYHMFKLVRRL